VNCGLPFFGGGKCVDFIQDFFDRRPGEPVPCRARARPPCRASDDCRIKLN